MAISPLVYANPAFYRMTGYEPEDVIGNDCRFLQRGLTTQPGLEVLRTAIANAMESTVLLHNFRKDGTEFWNDLMVSPVLNEQRDANALRGHSARCHRARE